MTTTTQPEASLGLPHVSPWQTYCEIVWRSFWVTFIFVGLSTALIEQTGNGLPLTSLGLIALGCLVYSLFASAPFGVAAWIGQFTFPCLQRTLEFLAILFFAIAIFAPAPFGQLDGAELHRQYPLSYYLWDWSRFFGTSAIVLVLFWYALRKNFPLFRWVCVLAIAFSLYACVSKEIFSTEAEREARQTEMRQIELENLGSEKNIIVIVVDSLQGGIAEIALREEALRQEYDDFMFFHLGVSPANYTVDAIPFLLSGSSGQDSLWLSKKYRVEETFFHDAREAGYGNRLFLSPELFYSIYPHCVSFSPYQIPMLPLDKIAIFPSALIANVYSVVYQVTHAVYLGACKNLPVEVSRWIIKKGENVIDRIFGMRSTAPERLSEREFVRGFKNWEVGSEKKELLFYHHMLFHVPLHFDRQGNIAFYKRQLSGDAVIGSAAYHLETLSVLFRKLKEKGLWDDSLVIVVADHGFRFEHVTYNAFDAYPEIPKKRPYGADPYDYHPVFLIKFPHHRHPLEPSNIPISLSDIRGLIAQYVNKDDWTNVKPDVLAIPIDRENEIYFNRENEISFTRHGVPFSDTLSERITFRGGADAIPAAIEKYEREHGK